MKHVWTRNFEIEISERVTQQLNLIKTTHAMNLLKYILNLF